jgi:hypothetical protein
VTWDPQVLLGIDDLLRTTGLPPHFFPCKYHLAPCTPKPPSLNHRPCLCVPTAPLFLALPATHTVDLSPSPCALLLLFLSFMSQLSLSSCPICFLIL